MWVFCEVGVHCRVYYTLEYVGTLWSKGYFVDCRVLCTIEVKCCKSIKIPNFLATHLVLYPRTSTRGTGTHRTLLQSPHGPVPELCLVLPWCTADGGGVGWGVRTTFSHVAIPSSCNQGFSIKRIFPEY